MFGLPQGTTLDRPTPKKTFYDNIDVSGDFKRLFVEKIEQIIWRNALNSTSLNVAPGERVQEIDVFELQLREPDLNDVLLETLDRQMPRYLLFFLEYEGRYQARICLKEPLKSGNFFFKINRYYHSSWFSAEEWSIKLEGLDLDAVYANLVRLVAGDALNVEPSETVEEAAERMARQAKLRKQIASLEAKIRREKQLNRRMELGAELRRLKSTLTSEL